MRTARKKARAAKRNMFLSVAVMCILSAAVCVFAKFYKEYSARTESNPVIADYYIDLLGADKSSPLVEKLSIENLNPGETKDIVIYIANGTEEEDGSKRLSDVAMEYKLRFVHTGNLPLTYLLKDEAGNELAGTAEPYDEENPYYNGGDRMEYPSREMGVYDDITYQKYTVTISWDRSDNDAKYVKEIDVLYLVVDAAQQEPAR